MRRYLTTRIVSTLLLVVVAITAVANDLTAYKWEYWVIVMGAYISGILAND